MTARSAAPPLGPSAAPRFLPLLVVLFLASGAAALIYEIVWFQLLQLVIGSSAVSLGVLLGTFMGGMGLGSLALPRLVCARRHPLRVYALLELGTGALGILVWWFMPAIDRLYTASLGHGVSGIALRALVSAAALLPPTLLMGATLPALARWVEATPRGIAWLGFFYAGNIAGAVVGCLGAGFYLLPTYDVATATYVAAGLNVGVAGVSLVLAQVAGRGWGTDAAPTGARDTGGNREEEEEGARARASAGGRGAVYAAIALSGLSALGAEVVWTRLLALLLGATVYTFSVILAVFLVGLGLGSAVGARLARRLPRPALALGWCQVLLAAAVTWAAYALARSLPFWPIDPSLSSSAWCTFQLDVLRCAWAILPAACCWGASFPLALAGVAGGARDSGRLVGGVYAANTLGAILGALGFSMVLIPWAGTQTAQRVLVGLPVAAALLAAAGELRVARAGRSPLRGRRLARAVGRTAHGQTSADSSLPVPPLGRVPPLGLIVVAALSALLIGAVPATPWKLVAYGRYVATHEEEAHLLYLGEGANSSIAVTVDTENQRYFHVSGKIEASSAPHDMRLQRLLGHLPAFLHPRPRSVLVVGCGAGVTAGSFIVHPDVERIVICELEPLIPPMAGKYFAVENHAVVDNPRVQIVHDDARHYILTTPEKFDIITSDPIHPWVKGSATLYSREYFELCRQRLNPGGLVTQWVPLYESDVDVVKCEVATFLSVFPHGTMWSNDTDGVGYDTVMLGGAGPMTIDVDELQQRLHRDEYRAAALSLKEVGFQSAVGLLATYAGRGRDWTDWLAGAAINRDRNLRLQYLAGLGLNAHQRERILDEILVRRKYPDDLFTAAPILQQSLRDVLK